MFCHKALISKIDQMFRKRMRIMNDHIEIIARGIAELHQRFDELEKTLSAHDRLTQRDHTETK